MKQASVAGWTGVLAATVSAAVLALMLNRGLADPVPGDGLSLDPLGWGLLVASFACLVISVVMVVYTMFLKHSVEAAAAPAGPTPSDVQVRPEEEAPAGPDLSRLPEDERRLYEIIEAAGGEILQMNLVSSGEFSKSKVTRLLDKLEGRELIKRERHGMTNKVMLTNRH